MSCRTRNAPDANRVAVGQQVRAAASVLMVYAAPLLHANPAFRRLAALSPLDGGAEAAIEAALMHQCPVRARREIVAEGARIGSARLVVKGWAARVRLLSDGRRQFLNFLLPGDLIGLCRHPEPVAVTTVTALTDLTLCPAPLATEGTALERVYSVSQALDEAYLFDQVVRLGRLNAQERLLSLLLEFHERLGVAGLANGSGFDLPLTQEVLADALGLTSVHVNRVLQLVRRLGDVDWRHGHVSLRDPMTLGRTIGRSPVRVSAAH